MMKHIFLSFAIVSVLLSACGTGSQTRNSISQKGTDIETVLATQDQQTDSLPPLADIEQRIVTVPFITKDDTLAVRPVRMFIPKKVKRPMPVVYNAHYGLKENSSELRNFIAEGWAVVTPIEVRSRYHGQLTDDDLVFNNAALYTVRHTPDFDPQRIMIVGGSAGGYMSMMLAGLHMGICANYANVPVENAYFSFYQHFNAANKVNEEAQSKDLPLPYIGIVYGLFYPNVDNFPDKEDYDRWAALSPIGLVDCYSSPFLITVFTSDLLVPIDQTTRKYTYEKNGDSMPKGLSTRLDRSNPGILGKALDELLAPSLTSVKCNKPVPEGEKVKVPYDASKPFNICVTDDGPVESFSSHNNGSPRGKMDVIPYLKDMATRSLTSTEMLRPEKLRLLLERYAGRSVQLPAHQGVDDNAYGSLKVYQEEVVEELARYAGNHSVKEIDKAVAGLNDEDLSKIWKEIRHSVK